MNREVHVRVCEWRGVQFPGPTRLDDPELSPLSGPIGEKSPSHELAFLRLGTACKGTLAVLRITPESRVTLNVWVGQTHVDAGQESAPGRSGRIRNEKRPSIQDFVSSLADL